MRNWNELPKITETIARHIRDQAVNRVISTMRDEGEPFTERDLHEVAQLAAHMALDQFGTYVKHEIAMIEAEHKRRLDIAALRPSPQMFMDAQAIVTRMGRDNAVGSGPKD